MPPVLLSPGLKCEFRRLYVGVILPESLALASELLVAALVLAPVGGTVRWRGEAARGAATKRAPAGPGSKRPLTVALLTRVGNENASAGFTDRESGLCFEDLE